MKSKLPYIIAVLVCAGVGMGIWISRKPNATDSSTPSARHAAPTEAPKGLPKKKIPDKPVPLSDQVILTKGGVLPTTQKAVVPIQPVPTRNPSQPAQAPTTQPPSPPASVLPRATPASIPPSAANSGPQSALASASWQSKPNQLVQAIRASGGLNADHAQVVNFLHGKDLMGWDESTRNWIGDELMSMLRDNTPDKAYGDLKAIQEDPTAPAAMRDYSIQHISHLVNSGIVGKEGADYLWKAFAQNDPITVSTALISLHRISEQQPKLVAAEKVRQAAEQNQEAPDERLKITARAILKESQKEK